MGKRVITFFLMLSMALSLFGCGNNEEDMGQDSEQYNEQNTEQNTEQQREEVSLFDELKGNRFVFASGAGAWGTELLIGEDGVFEGQYHDSDMGSIGAGYPNGTVYFCAFTGQFSEPEKVNEYTYKMTINTIEYANEAGSEEILDEVLYSYSEAYGLFGAEEMLIYLQGAPIAELPEEYMSWVRGSAYIEEGTTALPFYGLYNEAEQCGFSSYNLKESLETRIAFTEELAIEIENSIQNDPLTQLDYNEKTQRLYEMWDSDLNAIWSDLKVLLDDESFDRLLQEQREWIAIKEAEVKKAGAEYEGGSMQPMVMNQKAAELTKIRVYELLEYLE